MDAAKIDMPPSPDNLLNLVGQLLQEQRRSSQTLQEWRDKNDEKLDSLRVEISKIHTELAVKTVSREELNELNRMVQRHHIMLTGIDEANGIRAELTKLTEKVENMEDEDNKKEGQNKIYQRIILWASGVAATITAALLINYFMK